ncbi:MAG: glycoside hydrolase family 3 N-terminal domain-containing protein, partial [Oscillospiraceae bacterium]|nr:glycoside hydrolase family 3 N-terminal domain-containing protein [Oscillospiraceae bacterium]
MKKTVSILMAVMMTVVFLFSGCAYAEGNSDDELEIILSNMTLREKVAQMMIASFRIWQEVPETTDGEQPAEEAPKTNITELNDEIREMVAREHFGGILLFGENFSDPEQTLRLVSDLQTTNRNGGGIPQLIFVDQEGGNVNRVPYSTIGVSNMALGASSDPEN